LRHAYEGLVVAQATRNPFEIERIRLQRRIDGALANGGKMSPAYAERFDLLKKGLNKLMAAGARTPEEAAELVTRIARIARSGAKLELETLKVWPDDPKTRPAAAFFVNERIDLLIREAETFRNDYRNAEYRNIFLALKKPLPFAGAKQNAPPGSADSGPAKPDPELDTLRYCGYLLGSVVFGCWVLTSLALAYQSRRTR
jgi:hypothetical protein